MIWLTGLTVLLWVTLCVSSAQEEKDILLVQNHDTIRKITAARGSSVKLSCNALYDLKLCGSLLRVGWYNSTEDELTDPRKYFTTVNETVSDNGRRRQVVTEILNLTPKDNGQYQCKGQCDSGETSVGHYIQITVQGWSSD